MSTIPLAELRGVFADGSGTTMKLGKQPLELPQFCAGYIDIVCYTADGSPKDISAITLLLGARRHPTDAAPALSLQFSFIDDEEENPDNNRARAEIIPGHWVDVDPKLYEYDVVAVVSDDDRFPIVPASALKVTNENTHPGDEVQVPDSQEPLAQGPQGEQGPPGPAPTNGAGDIGKAIVADGDDGAELGPVPAEAGIATGSGGTGNTSSATTGTATVVATLSVHETVFIRLDVAGTVLGTIADDGAVDSSGWQTLSHISSVDVNFPADWAGGNVVLTGMGCDGVSISETYVANPGNLVSGTKGFLNITAATASGGDGSHVADIVVGPLIGTARKPILSIHRVLFNGETTTPINSNTTEGTFEPTASKQADARYDIFYRFTHTHSITDPGHVHAGPAHTHVQT